MTTRGDLLLNVPTPEHMRDLGATLGRVAEPGDWFLLEGPFGAGKTTFVQGLATGLGAAAPGSRPSRLLVEASAALERIDRTPSDVTGLVVARGPGSFTGVRVALSVAKGMAAALGVPLWGIGSLDVLARAAAATELPVRAALEAGR